MQIYAQGHHLLKATTAPPTHAQLHDPVLLAVLPVSHASVRSCMKQCLDMLGPNKHNRVSCFALFCFDESIPSAAMPTAHACQQWAIFAVMVASVKSSFPRLVSLVVASLMCCPCRYLQRWPSLSWYHHLWSQ